jgi:hypothetical protein
MVVGVMLGQWLAAATGPVEEEDGDGLA